MQSDFKKLIEEIHTMELQPLYEFSQSFMQLKAQTFERYFMQCHDLSENCSILLGQRGIGKTTMIIQKLLQFAQGDMFDPSILYLQVDHYAVKGKSLFDMAQAFHLQGGKFLALDEIHKYENWSQEIKSICDSFPRLKLLASGSSALEVHKGTHDLSRRAIVYRIAGMSFREFLALNYAIEFPVYSLEQVLQEHPKLAKAIVDALAEDDKKILPLFKAYLQYGYYPYFKEYNHVEKFKITLEQNIHTTLESDLLAIYPQLTSHSIQKIGLLLAFIAKSVPYVPKLSHLKQVLDIGDERTLKQYLQYLQDSGLILNVPKASKKLAKATLPEKIYLQNPNLMQAIAGEHSNVGTMREVFFHNMLAKDHGIAIPNQGDFMVDENWLFEIGGAKKGFAQLKDQTNAYVASDNIELGFQSKVPLWLFGFLY